MMLKNSPGQASTFREPWTSRCSSWIYKRQRKQRSNSQYPLDHRKSKSSRKMSTSALLTTPKSLTVIISVAQVSWLFATPQTAADQASLSITNSQSLFKFMSIELVMPPNHLILCHPLLLPPSIFPSIRVFSNESVLHIKWPKYCHFSFSISPSNEYSGLISFRMDWFVSLCSPGESQDSSPIPQFKASILQCSVFFIVQLSHPYMTTGKTVALTRWTVVGKVMSLNFNMLSRFVITFLSRSRRLLISWLQSPSAVILEPPKIKSVTISMVSPSICHEVIGPDVIILVFWMLSFKPTFSHFLTV